MAAIASEENSASIITTSVSTVNRKYPNEHRFDDSVKRDSGGFYFCFLNLFLIQIASIIGTMPVGGVQSQNPTQGLVHWMSAVMAEHMTSNSHHDPTVGMHYMWNGGVDVSFFSFFGIRFFAASALPDSKSPTMTYDL